MRVCERLEVCHVRVCERLEVCHVRVCERLEVKREASSHVGISLAKRDAFRLNVRL